MRAFRERLPWLRLPSMLTSCGGPFTAQLSAEVASTELVHADSFMPSPSQGDLGLPARDVDGIVKNVGAATNGKGVDGDRADPGAHPVHPHPPLAFSNIPIWRLIHKCP